jgi:SAM-dependent MidA family methyltransferase
LIPPHGAAGEPELLEIMRREIDERGPMCFARFMDLALHHPRQGYYAGGASRIGPRGDFFTASDLGAAFGRCMARQIAEIARAVGPPGPFHVIEFGAGRGLLARDVLDALGRDHPDLGARVRYTMVDRSPAMRRVAGSRAPEARVLGPDELGAAPVGCVLAVELFDAVPVHRLRRRAGRLVEVRVARGARGTLVEVEVPPCPDAAAWSERYGAAAEEGSEAEVAPEADALLDGLARSIERGAWIIVDYGDRAERLYGRERRRGTLLAYHAHATNERYLERVGEQDLTAHVNFSALEDRARATGLDVLGLTTQDRFLIGNGLLDEFDQQDAAAARDPARVKRRLQAMQLLHPLGMGRIFRVLVLGRGLGPGARLAGLADPFARR